MAELNQVFSDPNFQGLPLPEKIKAIKQLDPNFAGLPAEEQGRAAVKLFMGGDSHEKFMQGAGAVANSRPGAIPKPETITNNQILSPQEIEQKTSPQSYAQPAMPSQMKVMETLNAPIEAGATAAGRYVQGKVEPVLGGTASDIAGALTKEGLQFLGPQALSTGARLAAKGAAMIAPGAQGGKMESLISKAKEGLQSGLGTAQRSEAGYTRVFDKNTGGKIPIPQTQSTVQDILANEASHGVKGSGMTDIESLQNAIHKQSGAPTMGWLDNEMTRIGEKTRAVQGVNPDPMYQRVYGSMIQDLEKAPSGKGILLRAKDEAVRRRKGFEDVIDEFNNMVMTKRGTAGAQDINANRLGDKLKRDEFLQKSLTPEDWKDIEPLLTKLADTASLPAGKGVSYGSGRALARGAVAGSAAAMLGGSPYVWAGATTALDYATGHLLMTKTGRSLIKAVLESKAYEPSQKMNIINGMGRLAEKGINAVQGATQ